MNTTASHPAARRAVVIGASMAGLLAARVLTDHYDEVILLERDALPDGAAPRKGTPQAVHAHGLLARGREILESLFPGFTDALAARGARIGDIGDEVMLLADRRPFVRRRLGVTAVAASRLLIEAELRRRVLALPGVQAMTAVNVIEPVCEGGRVTGVRWAPMDGGAVPRRLPAALVLDCSGRASRTPAWLRAWGFEAPTEERMTVRISYATQYFERDAAGDDAAVICTATPDLPRPGVLLAQEPAGDGPARWVLTLGGYGSDEAPTHPDDWLDRVRDMGSPAMQALVRGGRAIGPALRYTFAHSQRRYYERLAHFPKGYLVMGDAMASFNPIYGQGMTVAACEALALRHALAGGEAGLHRRFFAAAAKAVDVPWQLAAGADLALPQVQGARPLPVRLVNAYVARVVRAAARDAVVSEAFTRVMHLLAAPPSLFAPRVLWRVLRHGGAAVPSTLPRPGAEGVAA